MGPIIRIATACGFALAIVFLISIGQSGPAKAQGSIVCDFGPKKYKNCCKQSYREHPKMGMRARANDIDACMDAKPKAKKRPAKDTKEAAPKDTPKDSSKDSKKDDAKEAPNDEPTKPTDDKKD
jgi:hypothetical protein